MSHSETRSPRRRPSPSAITIVLALSGTVVSLMQTLVIPLLPAFPGILGVTIDDASWLVTATLLSSAVAIPVFSRCADMYGKRKLMVLCLAVMAVGSVLAAVGGSFLWLIIGRTLQGFSLALIPVGISIMRDELAKDKLGSGVALMSATVGIGSALGLPLAGVLFESLGWLSVFWVSAAAGILLLVAVVLVVPESQVRTGGSFDYAGALVLSGALGSMLLAISKGGSWGWGSQPVLLLFLTSTVLLAIWVPYELKVSRPIVDLRTSGSRTVLLTNLASLMIGFGMFANVVLTTQQLQMPPSTGYGFGLSIMAAGLCMVPSGLAMVLLAPMSGRIIRSFGGRTALMVGAVVMTLSYVGRVFYHDSIASVVMASTAVGIGTAITFAALPTLIMGAVPVTETASANGLNTLVRTIGTSTSSAAIAAVFTSVTILIANSHFPSVDAFKNIFWLAALAAAASVLAAVFIPGGAGDPNIPKGCLAADLAVQGRVLAPDHQPLTTAVASVLHTDGEPVGWSHVDGEGFYSVAIPGAGEYLMVINTAGWAPLAKVVRLNSGSLRQDFLLHKQDEIAGTVSDGGGPITGAVVTLLEAGGRHVSTTRTDNSGKYDFPLPVAGRYLLTMLHPINHHAVARKLAVDNSSVRLDFPSL
jgi:MFS family permease